MELGIQFMSCSSPDGTASFWVKHAVLASVMGPAAKCFFSACLASARHLSVWVASSTINQGLLGAPRELGALGIAGGIHPVVTST